MPLGSHGRRKKLFRSLPAYHVLASVELLQIVSKLMTCYTSVPALVLCYSVISNYVPRFLWQDFGVT